MFKFRWKNVDKLISEHFDKHYDTFEELKKDILAEMNLALKDIENGNYCDMEEVMTEFEEKFGLSRN